MVFTFSPYVTEMRWNSIADVDDNSFYSRIAGTFARKYAGTWTPALEEEVRRVVAKRPRTKGDWQVCPIIDRDSLSIQEEDGVRARGGAKIRDGRATSKYDYAALVRKWYLSPITIELTDDAIRRLRFAATGWRVKVDYGHLVPLASKCALIDTRKLNFHGSDSLFLYTSWDEEGTCPVISCTALDADGSIWPLRSRLT